MIVTLTTSYMASAKSLKALLNGSNCTYYDQVIFITTIGFHYRVLYRFGRASLAVPFAKG